MSFLVPTITKNLLITNIYKPPVITEPDVLTLYNQTGSTFTYQIDHLDTAFSDISFSVTTPSTFLGSITQTLVNDSTYQSSLTIGFSLHETDRNNTQITITIDDLNENETITYNSTIIFGIPYSTTVLDSLNLNITYNVDESV